MAIEVSDHTLTVRGERKEEAGKRERAMLRRERLERRFERCFELPPETDAEHVSASCDKGVLTLHVPKTATRKPKPRKIEITAG